MVLDYNYSQLHGIIGLIQNKDIVGNSSYKREKLELGSILSDLVPKARRVGSKLYRPTNWTRAATTTAGQKSRGPGHAGLESSIQ